MAIEKITKSLDKTTLLALTESDDSLAKKVAFNADDAARKTKLAADLVSEAAANVPDLMMVNLQESIEAMLTVINGYLNPKNLTFDPIPAIAKITTLLTAVILQLLGLQVPSIPGLTKIQALLALLTTAASAVNTALSLTGSKPENNPEISPEIMNIIQDLLIATLSLCCVIPLAILKLVFDMFTNVIYCFTQIMPYNKGLPIIPTPLITAPLCSAAMSNVMSFVTSFCSQMSNVTYGTFRKLAKMLQDALIPILPIDNTPITNGAAAPTRAN